MQYFLGHILDIIAYAIASVLLALIFMLGTLQLPAWLALAWGSAIAGAAVWIASLIGLALASTKNVSKKKSFLV